MIAAQRIGIQAPRARWVAPSKNQRSRARIGRLERFVRRSGLPVSVQGVAKRRCTASDWTGMLPWPYTRSLLAQSAAGVLTIYVDDATVALCLSVHGYARLGLSAPRSDKPTHRVIEQPVGIALRKFALVDHLQFGD
jgi:hypothetical protein